jgi:hypothetical protein
MAQVDVLGRIVSREVNVVRGLAEMCGARHAGVPVGYVKPTRVAYVPVCKTFHRVRKWWCALTIGRK